MVSTCCFKLFHRSFSFGSGTISAPKLILEKKCLHKFRAFALCTAVGLVLIFSCFTWLPTNSNFPRSIQVPNRLMEIMVGGALLAEELSPTDLFMEDSYVKADLLNPWIHRTTESGNITVTRKGFVIPISSVSKNRLSHVGGTGHWYHLLQTVLPSIKEAHDHIWGEESKKRMLSRDPDAFEDIYLVFNEAKSVDDLNSFTRFCLGTVLAAGQFKRIHYGYADKAVISSEVASLVDLHVSFTADFEKQALSELFVTSSISYKKVNNKNLRPEAETVSFQHFFSVQLMAPRRQFMWFLTPEKKFFFKNAYSQQCKLPASSPAVADILQYSKKSTELLTTNNLQKNSGSQLQILYATAQMLVKNTPHELFTLPVDDIETVANIADRDLILYSSPTNPFRSGLALSKAFVAINSQLPNSEGTHTVANNGNRKVIVYQRDVSRRFINEQEIMRVLEKELKESSYSHTVNGTSVVSVPWTVELVKHDRNRSPCDLVHLMQSTTALLTSHGFQSTLLLFLPDESVLAEVHPGSAFFPHHFGQLQLAFRQRFGDKRSFLVDESPPSSIVGRGLELLFGSSCESFKFCRSLAKGQDVYASRIFLSRFATFLKTHFLTISGGTPNPNPDRFSSPAVSSSYLSTK
jgi:hypothetical protein